MSLRSTSGSDPELKSYLTERPRSSTTICRCHRQCFSLCHCTSLKVSSMQVIKQFNASSVSRIKLYGTSVTYIESRVGIPRGTLDTTVVPVASVFLSCCHSGFWWLALGFYTSSCMQTRRHDRFCPTMHAGRVMHGLLLPSNIDRSSVSDSVYPTHPTSRAPRYTHSQLHPQQQELVWPT